MLTSWLKSTSPDKWVSFDFIHEFSTEFFLQLSFASPRTVITIFFIIYSFLTSVFARRLHSVYMQFAKKDWLSTHHHARSLIFYFLICFMINKIFLLNSNSLRFCFSEFESISPANRASIAAINTKPHTISVGNFATSPVIL